MDIFELTLQRKITDFWPVVAEFKRPGRPPVVEEGRLRLDSTHLTALELTPHAYGQALGESLFRELVRDLFIRALPHGQENRLHVWLHVEDEALRALRWERLAVPIGREWLPLALNQQTPFSQRSARWPGPQFLPFTRRELRALIVVASPAGLDRYDLKSFNAGEAAARVQRALGPIPCDVLADAGVASSAGLPTLDALVERLTQQRYSLLHLVAHARFVAQKGETYLFLADPEGQATPVAASELIRRLRLAQGARGLPHLAFLAACQTAMPQAEALLGGMGQRLVRELGMPAVIAMTESVSVDTAFLLSQRFYERLAEHGRVDQALAEAASQLAGRQDILTPALFTCLEGQSLFVETRPLQASDVQYGIQQMMKLLETRAPVLLVDEQADGGEGQFTLASRAWEAALAAPESQDDGQQQPQAAATVKSLCDQAVGMSFDRLALGASAPAYELICPFPGLGAFQAGDRRFFRGRQQLVNDLLRRAQQNGVLALVGPSGCGKSSLALAGLAPQLADRHPGLHTADLRPGAMPLAELDAALDGLGQPAAPYLLIVDQFEELFTQCQDESQHRAFIERLLAEAVEHLVVLTLRDEFLDDCQAHSRLYASLQSNLVYVTPMSMEELGVAMQAQANAANLVFEAGLVNTILDHIADEPGRMPLLQHGLFQLWKRRRGRWLLGEEYRATGGIQGAIAASAELVYQQLSHEEQDLMHSVLVRLVRVDENDPRRDSSRRMGYPDLVTGKADLDTVIRLVQRLADQKLLVTSFNPARNADDVQLTHEALIRQWTRFSGWIGESRAELRFQQSLQTAATEWLSSGEDSGSLYRGARLAQAREWLRDHPGEQTELEQAFIAASIAQWAREEEERERQHLLELELARQRADEAEARARQEKIKAKRLRLAVVVLALLIAVPTLIGVRRMQQNMSSWKRVAGLPANTVNALAAQLSTGAGEPTFCAGTTDIGLGCSQDGERWNIYRQSLPTGEPGRSAKWFAWSFPNNTHGIRAVTIDPMDTNRILVSVYGHGVWKSNDGGRVMKPSNEGLPEEGAIQLAMVGDSAVAVFDSTRGNGMYASRDSGNTWQLVGGEGAPPLDRVYAVVLSNDGRTLYVGAENGVFSSPLDGAWQWTQQLSTAPVRALTTDVRGTLYAATWQPESRTGGLLVFRLDGERIDFSPFGEQPKAITVASTPNQGSVVFVLLMNKVILAFDESGQQTRIGSYPDWWPLPTHVTLLALPANATADGEPALWLGHTEGLFAYKDRAALKELLEGQTAQ